MRRACLWSMAFFFLAGCANRVSPTGGVKDVMPPKLINAVPATGTVGFSTGTIHLIFDEYVQLKDASQQIIISPPVAGNPQYSVRKKSVIIEFDSLPDPNTTYNIHFGTAIADIHEGNVLHDLQYVFSTGTMLDSLEISGTINDALTLKPVSGAHALLYKESVPDTLLLLARPSYMARSNEQGAFNIKNMAPGRYRLLAIAEKNPDLQLNSTDENAGFHPAKVTAGDTSIFDLRIYKPVAKRQGVGSCQITTTGTLTMTFLRPADTVQVQWLSVSPDTVVWSWTHNRDTLLCFMNPAPPDSLHIAVSGLLPVTDTLTCTRQLPGRFAKKPSAVPTYTLYPPDGGILMPETMPTMQLTTPLQVLDSSLIRIVNTDSLPVPVSIQMKNQGGAKVEFSLPGDDQGISITLLPGAMRDFYGRVNDTIRWSFTGVAERSTGSISLNLKSITPERGLLQLVDDKDAVIRQRSFSGVFNTMFALLRPGNYRLRIIIDENANGQWDPGDHLTRTLPEEVLYYRDTIMVRANWEVEAEW